MGFTVVDKIIRIEGQEKFEVDDTIVIESHLEIMLNGNVFGVLQCRPDSREALVYGYLLSKRMICSKSHVTSLIIDEEQSMALVCLASDAHYTVTTNSDFICNVAEVRVVANQFIPGSDNFRSTGALHSAALCQGDQILIYMEDVSRHCALDKVLGQAILKGIQLNHCYVMTSGRVPTDMFEKVLAGGIPAIFSRSAPTWATIQYARETNTILCGFVRGTRMNIYSGADRIILTT